MSIETVNLSNRTFFGADTTMDRINPILTSIQLERRAKLIAYSRRKWLSKLLKTGNKKVIDAHQKYDRLCAGNTETFWDYA